MPGVKAVDSRDAPVFQELVQIIFAAEVGGLFAPFPHYIAADVAVTLKVRLNDSVVADERIGLQDDLPVVGGVREGLYVAVHAGGEDEFANRLDVGAEGHSLEDGAVA